MPPTHPTVATTVIDGLRRAGIDTLFCVPGVQNDDFFDALVDAPDVTTVMARHEQGAAYMAMGAAQVSGRPAAFCVVPGAGVLNAGAALTSAYWAYARVVAIVGQIASDMIGKNTGTLHDLPDQTAILAQLTKHTELITDLHTASQQIQRGFDQLCTGLPRPVSIEVPVDVWARPTTGDFTPTNPANPTVDESAIIRAADLLAKAERPLIVVGSGAYEAASQVQALAERLQAAVTTRRMGHGVLPTSHPLFVPITVAHELWPEADVVLGIGTRMEWPLLVWGQRDLTLIQVNIDESEVNRHGTTTVGIHADASEACTALLAAVGPGSTTDRTAALDALRRDFDARTAHLEPQRSICAAIRDAMPDDGVIVEDVTQIGFAAHLLYDHRKPRTFLSSGAAGTLGAGTAVAIGAATATENPVVGVVGDGGFMFTATELATAAQYDIPVTIMLFEDGAFGNVQRIQKNKYGPDRVIASTLQNPDFAQFADSFGIAHWHPESPEALTRDLGQAITHDGPALVVMKVDEMPDPWPFLRMAPNRI